MFATIVIFCLGREARIAGCLSVTAGRAQSEYSVRAKLYHAPCPMPCALSIERCALCRMLYVKYSARIRARAQQTMPYALCPMPYVLCVVL